MLSLSRVRISAAAFVAAALSVTALADESAVCRVAFQYRYETRDGRSSGLREQAVTLPASALSGAARYASDPGMEKTVLVTDLADVIHTALKEWADFEETDESDDGGFPIMPYADQGGAAVIRDPMPITTPGFPTPGQPGLRPRPPIAFPPITLPVEPQPIAPAPVPAPEKPSRPTRADIGKRLAAALGDFERAIEGNAAFRHDEKIQKAMDLARKLAANMQDERNAYDHGWGWGGGLRRRGFGGPMLMAASFGGFESAVPKGLAVASGGAMDIGAFEQQVQDGSVPEVANFPVDGFLKTFNLSLQSVTADDVIYAYPGVLVDPKTNRLYIQVGIDSAMQEAQFQRPPLNLSLVLDHSGSMGATDSGTKTRWQWAVEAARESLDNLTERDLVSVSVFDDRIDAISESVPATAENKAMILERLQGFGPRGSTNMHAALKAGFQGVARRAFELGGEYEHRVLLVSDARANEGRISPADFAEITADASNLKIGLTVIGVGEDFNQTLVDLISRLKGGNYIFAASGEKMAGFFRRFKFLVTPAAYNFQAKLKLDNLNAKLLKSYGIEAAPDSEIDELVKINTLFFVAAEDGGGATVLVYQLPERAAEPAAPAVEEPAPAAPGKQPAATKPGKAGGKKGGKGRRRRGSRR